LSLEIPYPGTGQGGILRPGNIYDADEWTAFLFLHDIDSEDVYRIDFLDDGRMTIYRYRRTPEGHLFASDEEKIATMDPVTIRPKAPFPTWS
jgi:hypothetical protein